MAHEEQLAWESRAGKPAAAAAFLSAIVGFSALVIGQSLQKTEVHDLVEELLLIHRHQSQYLVFSVLQGLSVAALSLALAFLYRATKPRWPKVPKILYYIALIGGPLLAVSLVLGGVNQVHAANRVVPHLPLAPKQAIDLAQDEAVKGLATVVGYGSSILGLAFAVTMGLLSVNARRAGLLSQFMSILGVIAAALFVLGGALGMPPIVQYFWTVALGLLFIDRWPGGGRGPAWETGEAIPWPTAAEIRAAQMGEDPGAARPQRPQRPPPKWLERLTGAGPAADGSADGDDPIEVGETPEPTRTAAPHPRSKKRKKKKRR